MIIASCVLDFGPDAEVDEKSALAAAPAPAPVVLNPNLAGNCEICHREILKHEIRLEHRITHNLICRECERRIVLHSPKDFDRK